MNVQYVHKPAITFIGFSTEILPEDGYTKCPEFWEKEYTAKYARLFMTHTPENDEERAVWENMIGLYALCIDGSGKFEYMIAGEYKGGAVPDGFRLFTVPESEWAVFSAKGPLPDSLQTLNTAVWQEWYPGEGQNFLPNGMTTVEVYSAGDSRSPDYECGIWVPVIRK